jgi:hypothetical protein
MMSSVLRAGGASKRCSVTLARVRTACGHGHPKPMLGHPGTRLPILANLIRELKGVRPVRIMETHNGLTGLIVETASARRVDTGERVTFDGMWSSSLTASSAQGKPDIETVDTTVRAHPLPLSRSILSVAYVHCPPLQRDPTFVAACGRLNRTHPRTHPFINACRLAWLWCGRRSK